MNSKYTVQFYSGMQSSVYKHYSNKKEALKAMREFIKHERIFHSKKRGYDKVITNGSIELKHAIYASVFTLLTDNTEL